MNADRVGATLAAVLALLVGVTSWAGEVVIDAADLAPEALRTDAPAPGKWWLKRDANAWGASNGTILLTGLPTGKPRPRAFWAILPADRFVTYRVPELVVAPTLRGWHRIVLGLYHQEGAPEDRLLIRLSDQPHAEYLQTPREARARVVEVAWKPADLTGKTIHILQPPAPPQHPGHGWVGGISHIRFVPMTPADVAAARREIELPPHAQRLFGMLDYTDEVFWWGGVETKDDIRAIVYRHREAGFGRIYWRCFGTHLDHALDVPDAAPVWTAADEARWCRQKGATVGWSQYIDIARRFDPLKVAADYGREIGCEVHAWVRFTNFNREPRARFWHEHPEFYAQMLYTRRDPKTGRRVPVKPYRRYPYSRVLSMAYPEVRAFYVAFFKRIAATGTRGIMIDLLRHPPIAGYEPIVSDAFRKKHGTDMELRDIVHDPLVQAHLSQYLELFLKALRKEIGDEIEISVRCSGPSNYALRGKEWIAAGLIDTIVDGNWQSGNVVRPTIGDTVQAVGARGKAFAVSEAFDFVPDERGRLQPENVTLRPARIIELARRYSGRGVARFGLYESTVFTSDPEHRRAIRAAGWLFDPTKKTEKRDD